MWTKEVQYLFDLNGYVIFKDYFSRTQMDRLRADLESIEAMQNLPPPLIDGKPRSSNQRYISNIAEGSSALLDIVKDPGITEIVRETTSGYFRFNHSYYIAHSSGAYTSLHMGGAPIHPKAIYTVQGSRIISTLTKAVIPIDNHEIDDGCFCVVPGSHKVNFDYGAEFNLGDPIMHPAIQPLDAKPGDLILFTEALQHGGLTNRSGRVRKTIYYCYSLGNVVDWGGSLGLRCSNDLLSCEDDEIRNIVSIKGRLGE